jgi:hyperosmotically inducible periplasmic protein
MKRARGAEWWAVLGAWALSMGVMTSARGQPLPGGGPVRSQVSQIQTRLQEAPELKNNPIEVSVANGVATLKGKVDTQAEKAQASRLASVSGIVGVDNRLEVGSASLDQAVSDSALTASVKEKLEANEMNRFDGVAVTTRNGVITLTGSVQNEQAMKKVLDIAQETDGVTRVDNKLRVAQVKQY